jgi:transcriptional regulator with XRE-family HTH domain
MEFQIGERIASVRKQSQLTLEALSKRSRVAKATISKIERNLMSPSIETLFKISRGLDKSLSDILSDDGFDEVTFTKNDKQNIVELNGSRLKIRSLTRLASGMKINAQLAVVEKGASSAGEHSRREGEEFVYCLSGCLTFKIKENTYNLEEGDSIHFRSHMRHEWFNEGSKKTELLWFFIP